jgi:hypothetical protein
MRDERSLFLPTSKYFCSPPVYFRHYSLNCQHTTSAKIYLNGLSLGNPPIRGNYST